MPADTLEVRVVAGPSVTRQAGILAPVSNQHDPLEVAIGNVPQRTANQRSDSHSIVNIAISASDRISTNVAARTLPGTNP